MIRKPLAGCAAEEIALFTALTALSVRLIIAHPHCLGPLTLRVGKSHASHHATENAGLFRIAPVCFATHVGFPTQHIGDAGTIVPTTPQWTFANRTDLPSRPTSPHATGCGKQLA
jgi:hypothetical protein